MATVEEGWHVALDSTKLYTKTWKPASSPVALIVFVHGFSDHCNNLGYAEFSERLCSHAIQTFAFDQRGWGRSVTMPSQKGLTGPTSLVLDDISSVLQSLLPSLVPVFLMGHSMGGAEILHFAAHGPLELRLQIAGYLAESPWISLHPATQPSKALVMAGKLASRLIPRFQMVQHVEAQWVSRDEVVVKAYIADELCHDTGTLEGLAGCLARAAQLDKGQVLLKDDQGESLPKLRIWLGHGTADRVTSFEASKKFMERLAVQDKEFKVYDGWYHKCERSSPDVVEMLTSCIVHVEPGEDKVTFANDIATWVLARAVAAGEHNASDSVAKSKL